MELLYGRCFVEATSTRGVETIAASGIEIFIDQYDFHEEIP
jgi:hypothetical protein